MIEFFKAHAYGNDFLLAPEEQVGIRDRAALAREACARHTGVGADGLVVYRRTGVGVSMKLFNSDGSAAEVSGNALRCLAATLVRADSRADDLDKLGSPQTPPPKVGLEVTVDTDAFRSTLTFLGMDGSRYHFRATMGRPTDLRAIDLDVAGERVRAIVLSVGNPQCVVVGPPPDEARLHRFGPALATHAAFPAGTNVELAHVEAPDRIRILIWERGVGPTTASGTGACAAAVAAAAYGGAERDVEVISPGGSQRVVWDDQGLQLTGWAEVRVEARWLG